jgi:5-methylcytosine-specific restriction endonuclease McrA
MAKRNAPTTCQMCDNPVEPHGGRGRPRLYCSNQCRGRSYMANHYAVNVDAIVARWGDTCYLCGDRVDRDEPFGPKMLNVDHIVPLSRDGGDFLENMRVVHYACNLRKAGHLVCPHCTEAIA